MCFATAEEAYFLIIGNEWKRSADVFGVEADHTNLSLRQALNMVTWKIRVVNSKPNKMSQNM